MENKYTVDYDKKIVTLHFDGEIFNFNLNEGDVGDFWHSFTTKAGIIKDVNFYREDAGEVPNFSVYGVKKSKGGFLIDTSDEIYISNFEQVGNPVNYFGEDGEEISEDRKSCDNCDSTNGSNNSSSEFQYNNCGHSETE